MRFAYADPPYYGMGAKMYGYPEWDDKGRHFELVSALREDFPDGWALSCNPRDLEWLLPYIADGDQVRVCPWVKTYHQIRPTRVQYAWEPVLLVGGRKGRATPMVRDWLAASATRLRGTPGAKPPAFCRWVLGLLGYDPAADEIVDLFPGSGIMGAIANQGVLA